MQKIVFAASLVGIYLVGFATQSSLLLNWDVSWLMHAAEKLLQGGSYSKDFFEFNPPMIIYLSIPPVLLTKIIPISIIHAEQMYVFLLATLILFISSKLIKHYFNHHKLLQHILILTLAICFLIVPIYEFGQREHLMLMLIMPYILSINSRPYSSSVYLRISIGLLAGIGFSLKPYFLITPFLLEIYALVKTKNRLNWWRIETICIALIIVIYTGIVYLFHPDYIQTVAPLAMRIYHSGINSSWEMLYLHSGSIFCYTAILFYLLQNNHKNSEDTVFCISLIGFLLAFFWQRTYWFYHLYPAFCFALLLSTSLITQFISHHFTKKSDLIFLGMFSLCLYTLPIYTLLKLYDWGLEYKKNDAALITYLNNSTRDKSIYIFSTTTVYTYPAIDYAATTSASRTAFLGWIPGMIKRHDTETTADKKFLLSLLIDDFKTKQPDFVFIDIQKDKPYLEGDFNYLQYFADNQEFNQLWKSYRYKETITYQNFYMFDIYSKVH